MKNEELNKKIIENFPNLCKKYYDEVSWQEGDSTGSHTVFGDIFTPYVVECVLKNDTQQMSKIFNFLENLLCINDEYAQEVVSFSVFESIAYLINGRVDLIEMLGEYSKKVLTEVS